MEGEEQTGKLEPHALELSDRLSKLFSLVSVRDRFVERSLRQADHLLPARCQNKRRLGKGKGRGGNGPEQRFRFGLR